MQKMATEIVAARNANTAMDDPTAMAREDVCSKITSFPLVEVSAMKQQNMVFCDNVSHFL